MKGENNLSPNDNDLIKKSKKPKKNGLNQENKDTNMVKEKKFLKVYFSYNFRLTINIVTFIGLSVLGLILFSKTVNYVDLEDINYYENSKLDYKVYLKDNEFYEQEYLEKDMLYVASLINNISIDFNYDFKIDKNIDLNSTYKIVGKLIITDPSGSNTFFEKEYDLISDKNISIENKDTFNIAENLSINYAYYNNLANSFKSQYGVDVKSSLIVYLKINNKTLESEREISLNDNREMAILIPLSERSITIKMDYKEINDSSKVIKSPEYVFNNNIIILIELVIVLLVASIVFFKIIKMLLVFNKKKSSYDKLVKKILNEYDRLVVETEFFPDLNTLTIIKISKFQELLDVRDNLKLPIMYYNVASHQKCHFYIKDDDNIYLHTIKSIDLDGKYEKE